MTLEELLKEGGEELLKAGTPDAALDARFLLLAAFDLSLASFLGAKGREISGEPESVKAMEVFRDMIRRRAMREPLQQILGVQEFMGLEFAVNSHVLVPRQDTETLVELVLSENRDRDQAVLDMCTGSGCIGISLARMGGYRRVTLSDLSGEALKVAGENARRLLGGYEGEFSLARGDMFGAVKPGETFDILVSNPPYIPSGVIGGLEPEVRDYEPRMALDGDGDGLKFYRILANESGAFLRKGGRIYMEIGWDQGPAVEELFRAAGFEHIRRVRDLAGNERVVCASWP